MIKIKLCGQVLKISAPVIAADTIDYIEMAVDMSEDWQRMDSVLVRFELGETLLEAAVIDGRINKSQHINLERGVWRVSAAGLRIEDGQTVERITSTTASLTVHRTGGDGTIPPTPVEPSIVETILAEAKSAKTIAAEVQKRADDGEFNGKDGDPGADGFSPTARIERTSDGAIITITDKSGTTTAKVNDGQGGGEVTKEAITNALGYTPANAVEVAEIRIDNAKTQTTPRWTAVSGWRLLDNGLCVSASGYALDKYQVVAGQEYIVKTSDLWQFQSSASVPSSGKPNRLGETYNGNGVAVAPEGSTYLIVSRPSTEETSVSAIIGNMAQYVSRRSQNDVELLQDLRIEYVSGALTNGTPANGSNTYAVASPYIALKRGETAVIITDRKPTEGYHYAYGNHIYKPDKTALQNVDYPRGAVAYDCIRKDVGFYRFALVEQSDTDSAAYNPLRISDFTDYDLRVIVMTAESTPAELDELYKDTENKIANARHIKSNAGTPVTLLHFSDIHADQRAITHIRAAADRYAKYLDGIICTGDMVGNTNSAIDSWWEPDMMTAIGNHDSASYSGSYNWTALSMADRDAYYITPFKANWGVVHETGKSYYYKDYTAAKLRLIVLDVMLYSNGGADADGQTAWMSALLDGAISADYHVLIACHAPHGGSKPVSCDFTKYNAVTHPVQPDCNTPDAVTSVVAAKISAGLHFAGYICGHTHQDGIWDVNGDGKQLMYCVTCANGAQEAQWTTSDQDRSVVVDAYNIVTVDTVNSLVKLIRIGADIDDHMRKREQLCIDYAHGRVLAFSGSYNDLTDKPTLPEPVTDAHIISLIDGQLGVIENGTY